MRLWSTRPTELGTAEIARWRALQRENAALANPFLSPEFAMAVGRARPSARVAVVHDGGTPTGFFAHERTVNRVARSIGSGLADCQGFVQQAGCRWDTRELLARCDLVGWDFETLLDDQLPAGAYDVVRSSSPVIDVSGGYEAYLDARLSGSRKWVQSTFRKQRKLERELGEIRFEFDSRDADALRALMRWKSGQYAQLGEWDRFADPRIVQLTDELFETRMAECSGVLSVLYVDSEPAAAHFGLASSSVLSWWFPAYDPALSRYSPGILLLFMMAQGAAERGIGEIDLGRGRHDYKDAMKTGERTVASGSVDGPLPGSLRRRLRRELRDRARPLVKANPRLERTVRAAIGQVRRRGGVSP